MDEPAVVIGMVRILVDAGATHASAAAAAVILERGGTVAEAREVLVLADVAEPFDPALLLEAVARAPVAVTT